MLPAGFHSETPLLFGRVCAQVFFILLIVPGDVTIFKPTVWHRGGRDFGNRDVVFVSIGEKLKRIIIH